MADITLHVINKDTKALDYLNQLDAAAKKIEKNPIVLQVKAEGLDKVSKDALQYAKILKQIELAEKQAELQEKKRATASLNYGRQAEATRTAELNRMKATQQAAAALSRKEQQEEKTRTAAKNYAVQAEKTRTAEQNRMAATERTKATLAKLNDEQNKTTTSTINFGNAFTKVWSRIVSTLSRRLINQAFTALRSNIQETLTVMKSVDTQLINIQKVSGKTSQEIAAIGERAYDTAAKYGVAVEDYLSAVYSFQKAGLGENAEELAELATKTMLVGDTTSAVAEKFLVSSNAAWELKGNVEELNKVIDQADYINNNYATTLDKIAAGLPIVASVAANAGMSYSETMAALGTIQSITQESGTKSATALRALILNIEKEAGSYLSEDGEEFEVTEESIKGLQGLLEKYAKTEMDAARAAGELINPMVAIKALFEGMRNEDLNENELFQLLSAMGGKLRTNQLTALVRNFDMFDEMLGQLGDSAGTADKEIGLMMESWAKKTQVLKDRWTQFIAGLVSTDEIKGLVDNLTEFVTNLDPEKIGSAIRDFLQPLIDFIRNTDWAGAAQHLSDIFDKIMNAAKIGGIALALSGLVSAVSSIVNIAKTIGGTKAFGAISTATKDIGAFFSLLFEEGPAALTLIGPTGALALGFTAIVAGVVALGKAVDEHGKKVKVYEDLDKTLKDLNDQYDKLTGKGSELDTLREKGEDLTEVEQRRKDILEAQAAALDEQIKKTKQLALEAWNAAYGTGTNAVVQEYDANGLITGQHKGTKDEYDWAEIQHSVQMAQNEYGAGQIGSDEYRSKLLGLVDAYSAVYNKLIEMRDAGISLSDSQNSLITYYEQLALAANASADEIEEAQTRVQPKDFKGSSTQEYKTFMAAQQFWKVDIKRATSQYDAYISGITEAAQEAQAELNAMMGAGMGGENAWGVDESVISQMADDLEKIGQDGAAGMAQGLRAGTGDVAAASSEMADAVEGTLRDDLDTHSPSGVTEDIGEDVGHGLANGMRSTVGEIQSAAAAATRAIGTGIISQSGFIQSQISRIVGMAREFVSGLMSSAAMSYHWGNGNWVDRNGNFHSGANGIPARAGGDSNFPGGPTLVNELGPELISENGRAYIAGGGKPTVVNLAPGAIVIPADQTREALKGGMPKYGRAFQLITGSSGFSSSTTAHSTIYSNGTQTHIVRNRAGEPTGTTTSVTRNSGGGGGSSSGGGGGGSSSGPTKPDFDKLESALSDLLSKLEEQIKLAENEGDYPRVVELYEQAQEAISDLVEKYRKAGYADDSIEILKLLNKNYDYANKQLDVYRDKWDELIDALSADTDATKAAKELEEKRLALEEAQAAYENAQKQRTVRMYNAATGQWEWIADDKKIQSARDAVTSAEDSYTDAVKSQAIAELEKMKDTVSDLSDVVLGPALSTVVTMAETTEEFQNFARALNAVFGVGSFLQSTEGSTKVQPTVDSHDTNYTFGGVDISAEQAANMSLKELAQMLQVLKIT